MSKSVPINPESCWNCRKSAAGQVHGTLNCSVKKAIVRGPEREGCDSYKDSRKTSMVIPERGRL